jgi:hypothetical protein
MATQSFPTIATHAPPSDMYGLVGCWRRVRMDGVGCILMEKGEDMAFR